MIAVVAKLAPVACLLVGVADLVVIDLYLGPRALASSAHLGAEAMEIAETRPHGLGSPVSALHASPASSPSTVTLLSAPAIAAVPSPQPPAPPDVATPSTTPTSVADEHAPEVIALFGTAEATADAADALRKIADQLNADPQARIVIEGHADRRGDSSFNRSLSLRRANWARARLIELGVRESRMLVVGHGAARPVRAGSDAASLAANRRVEARIVRR